jgi:L-ascorbate metabolism protein UlaG (beta-lactamase superfamily)
MTSIQVNGGNLFQIAAQYLGDATQWIRIAQLNGLSDPMINAGPTPVILLIPPVDPNAGGGLAAQ